MTVGSMLLVSANAADPSTEVSQGIVASHMCAGVFADIFCARMRLSCCVVTKRTEGHSPQMKSYDCRAT